MNGGFVLIEPGDVLGDAAFVDRRFLLCRCRSSLTAIAKPRLRKASSRSRFSKRVVVESGFAEDFRIGPEGDFGSGAVGSADFLDRPGRFAAFVFLHVGAAVAANFGAGQFAQRRDRFGAHAMQAGRRLVCLVVELAAGPDDREDDFEVRALFGGMFADGNAAAVVADAIGCRRDEWSRGCACSNRPDVRRRNCRRVHRRGDASRARRYRGCNCPGACGCARRLAEPVCSSPCNRQRQPASARSTISAIIYCS